MSTQPMPATQPIPQGNPAPLPSQPQPNVVLAKQQNPAVKAAERSMKAVAHAASSLPIAVGKIVRQHDTFSKIRDRQTIDQIANSHVAIVTSQQKVNDQLKPLAEQIQKHVQELQQQPPSPQKTMQMAYLTNQFKVVMSALQKELARAKQADQQMQALLADPKNRKLISKAVGYDEKQANSPERQMLVSAINAKMQQAQRAASPQGNAMPSTGSIAAAGPQTGQETAVPTEPPGAPQPATGAAQLQAKAPSKFGRIMQVVGDILIPGRMAAIPGTEEHKQLVLNRALALEQALQTLQSGESDIALKKAQAGEYEAEAEYYRRRPGVPGAPRVVQLLGPDGKTAIEATEQSGKFYDAQGNEISNPQPYVKPSSQPHDAFDQWKTDPESFEKFQKFMASIKESGKGSSSWGTGYTAIHALQLAYEYNPEMIGPASKMVSQMMQQKGIVITPEQAARMAEIPADQPLSPETGKPIGSRMPEAPTGSTRTQAQVAARVLTELPAIRIQVNDLAEKLGPTQGRLMLGFLLGAVGSTGDKQLDTQLSDLRTSLHFVGSAAAKFHVNSVRAIQQFDDLIAAGKSSPAAIQGALDSIEKWAKTAQSQERGAEETGQPKEGDTKTNSSGDKIVFKGGSWQLQSK